MANRRKESRDLLSGRQGGNLLNYLMKPGSIEPIVSLLTSLILDLKEIKLKLSVDPNLMGSKDIQALARACTLIEAILRNLNDSEKTSMNKTPTSSSP